MVKLVKLVSRLEQLSADAVRNRVIQDDYPKFPLQLPPALGNLITKNMFHGSQKRTADLPKLAEYLRITNAEIRQSRHFDTEHCEFFFKQDLESLEMFFVQWEKLVDECRQLKIKRFDLIFVLRKLVNSKARHTMKTLRLVDGEIKLAPNWANHLGNFLPFLKTLDLGIIKMEETEFQQICNVFPNLTELLLRRTGIRNVNGISKLEGLELLDISECSFIEKEDLSDLFNLKELTFLKLTGVHYDARNIESYVANNRSPPKLTYIDFSSNAISNESLQKIVNTHLDLRTFLLIGCNFDNFGNVEEDNRHIKFYLSTSLSHCFESIDFCCFEKKDFCDLEEKLTAILEMIGKILFFEYSQQSTDNVVKCLSYLKQAHRLVGNEKSINFVVECLYILCSEPTRYQVFSHHQKEQIVDYLIAIHQRFFKSGLSKEHEILSRVWSVLKEPHVIEEDYPKYNTICQTARDIVAYLEMNVQCRMNAVNVLTMWIEKLDIVVFNDVVHNFRKIPLEIFLHQMLKNRSITRNDFSCLLQLVAKIQQITPVNCALEKHILIILYEKWLNTFKEYQDITISSLISILPSFGNYPHLYFKKNKLRSFHKLCTSSNRQTKNLAITLFVHIYILNTPSKGWNLNDDRTKKLIDDVCEVMSNPDQKLSTSYYQLLNHSKSWDMTKYIRWARINLPLRPRRVNQRGPAPKRPKV